MKGKNCKQCGNPTNRGGRFYCSNKCRGISESKHGLGHSRQWHIWNHMKQRCSNPKDKAFKNYGGRGITFARKWVNFVGFWEDMKHGYFDNLTLERIDVNKGYNKKNCTWIPKSEQSRNTRRHAMVEIAGKKVPLFKLSEDTKINYQTLYNRIFTYNFPPEIAIKKGRMTRRWEIRPKTNPA